MSAADCVGDYGQGEDRYAIFLGEPDGGGGRIYGGFEGAVEGWEGQLEVDCVVGGGGLDGVVFEDGFD